MKKNQPSEISRHKKGAGFCMYLLLSCTVLFFYDVNARAGFNGAIGCNVVTTSDTTSFEEKKIDYLERIYFSGKNKGELNVYILATLQELEAIKPATASIAKQYAFLSGIKEKANTAQNACDVLEMLAAGIFNIDANEGTQQNVLPPGEKAKGNALGALTSMNNTFGNISSNTGGAAYNAYILTHIAATLA